jgi:hypothetical protein
MIRPSDPAKIKAIEKADKEYQKAGQALAKIVASAFPPKTRVSIPVGKGRGEGVVIGRPTPTDPLRVIVQLDSYRDFRRAILYTEVQLLEDLFVPAEAPETSGQEVGRG